MTVQTREPGVKPAVVRAEQVGSLLRPARLLEAVGFDATQTGSDTHAALLSTDGDDRAELTRLEDAVISAALERQIAAGIGVVSDGEFRRLLYTASFYASVSGFEPSDQTMPFRTPSGEVFETKAHPFVARRLTKLTSPPAQEAKFLAAATDALFKITIPAPSKFLIPGVFRAGVTDLAYADQAELNAHIVELEKQLIAEAIASGARYIQLDFPLYTFLVDARRRAQLEAAGIDPDALLQLSLQADRDVIADVPDDVYTALHICRGNFRSMWLYEGSLDPLAEQLFSELPYDSFLIEWDDVVRDGDYSALRFLPHGKVAALGLISTKSAEMESPDRLLAAIESAARHADIEQLALCPQCGFASEAGGNAIDESIQWRKLELVGSIGAAVWPSG